MGHDRSGRIGLLMTVVAALGVAACNAALGGGVVALVGGAGFFAGQCYDRVRLRVQDPQTGRPTCQADVWLSEPGGSEHRLQPCYSAALTSGTWTLTARQSGFAPATTELIIPEHPGACPHYTHSIELTLRREGEPSTQPTPTHKPGAVAPSAAASNPNPLDSAPARIVPPPIPGGSATPVVPVQAPTPVAPPSADPNAPPPADPNAAPPPPAAPSAPPAAAPSPPPPPAAAPPSAPPAAAPSPPR